MKCKCQMCYIWWKVSKNTSKLEVLIKPTKCFISQQDKNILYMSNILKYHEMNTSIGCSSNQTGPPAVQDVLSYLNSSAEPQSVWCCTGHKRISKGIYETTNEKWPTTLDKPLGFKICPWNYTHPFSEAFVSSGTVGCSLSRVSGSKEESGRRQHKISRWEYYD